MQHMLDIKMLKVIFDRCFVVFLRSFGAFSIFNNFVKIRNLVIEQNEVKSETREHVKIRNLVMEQNEVKSETREH